MKWAMKLVICTLGVSGGFASHAADYNEDIAPKRYESNGWIAEFYSCDDRVHPVLSFSLRARPPLRFKGQEVEVEIEYSAAGRRTITLEEGDEALFNAIKSDIQLTQFMVNGKGCIWAKYKYMAQ